MLWTEKERERESASYREKPHIAVRGRRHVIYVNFMKPCMCIQYLWIYFFQVPPEVEEFVKDWVTKNYEAAPGNAIEQAIVYRHFAASMQSLGRKQGLNPVLLSNCVR